MNGNNTQSKEGFIGTLGHPRKVELAEMLLAEEVASQQAFVDAGFNRITVLEMARDIRTNVEGMEDMSFDWPRDEEIVATPSDAGEETTTPEPESTEETVEEVATPEVATPEATEVVDENAAPATDVPPAPQG